MLPIKLDPRPVDDEVGLTQPLFLIAGPCVIESEDLAMRTAGELRELTARLSIPLSIFAAELRR